MMNPKVKLLAVLVIGIVLGIAFCRLMEMTDDRSIIMNSREFVPISDSLISYFPNIGVDEYDFRKRVIGYMPVYRRLPLDSQIQEIATRISELSFRSLPIVVTSIEDSAGLKIAKIELRDLDSIYANRWAGRYFQGSTGGFVTEQTLIENLLQRQSDVPWIDGVIITYDGYYPGAQFDHVPGLFGLILRKPTGTSN